jgi:hypothetical protein
MHQPLFRHIPVISISVASKPLFKEMPLDADLADPAVLDLLAIRNYSG